MSDLNTATPGMDEQGAQPDTRPVVSEQLVHIDLQDERVQDVLLRVGKAIKSVYEDAEFVSYIGTNPLGVYVEVYTEDNDFDAILSILDDKLGNLQVAAGVAVCILPRQKRQAQAA